MPLTQTEAIEAFNHILSNVLEAREDGPLAKALISAGYDDIWTLATLHNSDIESLTYYKNENEKNIPLQMAHKNLLHIFFHHYCNHRALIGTPIGDDWTVISADDFNDYCMGPDYAAICNGSVIPPPTAGATPQPTWNTPSALKNLYVPRAQDKNDLFQEKQAMLQVESSPSTGSAASVSNKPDVEFGDAPENLPVPEITAPADLDQVQVYLQRVLPKPLHVPVILSVPRMPMDICAKLPPEVHEFLDQLDDYHKNVILATVEKSSSSEVGTLNLDETSISECLLDNMYLSGEYANGVHFHSTPTA